MRICRIVLAWAAFLLALANCPARCAEKGRLELVVVERAGGEAVPFRIHLSDSAGKAVRAPGMPFWRDHFTCPGRLALALAAGSYHYEVERGPEFEAKAGTVTVGEGGRATLSLRESRLADMAAEGWYSGELHVHRPLDDIELLMRAEDLHVAPVITWWNDKSAWDGRPLPSQLVVVFDNNRYYEPLGGEDEREGGALLFFHLPRPLNIQGSKREYPPPLRFARQAHEQGAWIDAEKPFWWDFPTWLASGLVDSVGIANNHMHRAGVYPGEAWGRARDEKRLPAPKGNGYWSQDIYYHALNCGLRVPPSAGSASGVLPNPVGYNRVYVHLDQPLTDEAWWQGLRAGRSFVTNGPLLRVTANVAYPGEVFTSPEGKPVEIELKAKLTSRDPVSTIEIIKDGRVERTVPAADVKSTCSLGKLRFEKSGWFLVRAVADVENTFRFASTAPFYVEVGPDKKRISRTSAQFFADWVSERMARIKLDDPTQREEVLRDHKQALEFWKALRDRANAD